MSWNQFLTEQLAGSSDFACGKAELTALEQTAIMTPLRDFGLIRFSGEETQGFLQGQLSSDIRAIETNSAQYSSYSTPKGRMLASFLIFRSGDDYLLQLPAELQTAIQKRLAMFIMRTKTRASDASPEIALIGLAGPQAASNIAKALGVTPPAAMAVLHGAGFSLIHLGTDRFELAIEAASAPHIWQQLQKQGCIPASTTLWCLAEIRAGTPWITGATQEEFVAQMANLDLTGAVSFTKGCYPGQEIVARTQYLGKLKRRMYRARIAAEHIQAGQDVYSPEMNGQASGKILLAAPCGHGDSEALVILQTSSLEHDVHLGGLTGPKLEFLPLPYPIA